MRLLAIALLSMFAMVPSLTITHGVLGLSNNASSVISLIITPLVVASVLIHYWRAKPGFEALPVDPEDPVMAEHVKRSRGELQRLLNGLEESHMQAYVKFPLTVGDNTEHVWGVAHSRTDESLIVSLVSNPVGGLSEDMLNRRHVALGDVEDWMLQDANGTTYGGYTMLALVRIYEREYGRLPRKMRKELSHFADFSLDELA